MLVLCYANSTQNAKDEQHNSAGNGKMRQNPQPIRNQNGEKAA
jgi:hypothetical protein